MVTLSGTRYPHPQVIAIQPICQAMMVKEPSLLDRRPTIKTQLTAELRPGLAIGSHEGEAMHIDWVAAATGATAIAAIVVAVVTIRSTAAQNRRQQLSGMATTAIGYFTGHSQSRSAGIAALRMVQAGLAVLERSEQEQYREGIRALLYGQLLYVYRYGHNRFEVHEIYNLESMSDWLCSKEIIRGLSKGQTKDIINAMEAYKKGAGSNRNEPAVAALIDKLPAWEDDLGKQGKRPLPVPDRASPLHRFATRFRAWPSALPSPSGLLGRLRGQRRAVGASARSADGNTIDAGEADPDNAGHAGPDSS
jgi:hypothetical protein